MATSSHRNQLTLALNHGQRIPQVGLGTWQAPKGEVGAAVREALAAGYKHIDCAAIYGNEAEIGEVFTEVFSQGKVKREDVWVTSKLWNTCHDPQNVRASCEKTLKDLQLAYLDLYLIHWPFAFEFTGLDLSQPVPKDDKGKAKFSKVTFIETWKAMEGLVDAGLVRAIGVSNFPIAALAELLPHCRIIPAMNQIEVNPRNRRDDLIDYCQSKGIHITAYSTFGSTGSSMMKYEQVQNVAKRSGKSAGQVLVRWAIQRGLVVIPKSVHADRIRENLHVFDFELTQQDLDEIKTVNTDTTSMGGVVGFFTFNPFV